jgi:hypothetical protein
VTVFPPRRRGSVSACWPIREGRVTKRGQAALQPHGHRPRRQPRSVLMEHRAKDSSSKLIPECTLPLTGRGVVHRVITDLAVLDITDSGFLLREVAPGVTADDVRHATAAPVTVTPISPRRQSNLPSDAPGPPLAR